jgi:hypothetical protein
MIVDGEYSDSDAPKLTEYPLSPRETPTQKTPVARHG